MEPPRLSLVAQSSTDLLACLASVDIRVPHTPDGRESQHREQYLMARVLATLAEEPDIRYPVNLLHREKPDFALRLSDCCVGVECVEAVSEEWKHIAAIRDEEFPGALVFPPMLKPGHRVFSKSERGDIASGQMAGPPWVGNMAERQWAHAIAYFVAKKTRKLRAGNYSDFQRHWLLVQDEWRVPVYEEEDKLEAAQLCVPLLKESLGGLSFERIYVSSGSYVIRLAPGPVDIQPVRDLWSE